MRFVSLFLNLIIYTCRSTSLLRVYTCVYYYYTGINLRILVEIIWWAATTKTFIDINPPPNSVICHHSNHTGVILDLDQIRCVRLDRRCCSWAFNTRSYINRSSPSTHRIILARMTGLLSSCSSRPITWNWEPTTPPNGSVRVVSTHTDTRVNGSLRNARRLIQSCWVNLQSQQEFFIAIDIKLI